MLIKLARLSLWNRRTTLLLTLSSLIISVALVLGIDHLRTQAKKSFSQTLSGTDLIVGARSGQLNLLLYAVFRIGNATNNISWKSYQELARHSAVAWTVPISLGDSHRGYRVLGTNPEYFEHYRYGQRQPLVLREGEVFSSVYTSVLGAEVARQLGYQIGDEIVLAHGSGAVNLHHHDEQPFTVVGILKGTGTPVDRTVHVSLQAIEAIHLDWQQGMPIPGRSTSAEAALQQDLTPSSITAVLVGLKSRAATFTLQRQVNNYKQEPLLAILPGVALAELWQILGMVEGLLYVIAFMVLFATLIGMMTSLLAAMNERQREIAILRAVGAGASYLFILIELEVLLLACLALVGGTALLMLSLMFAKPMLAENFGLFIEMNLMHAQTLYIAVVILGVSVMLGLVPAVVAYRRALNKGLSLP
jgi:putative ABC transport system permease protein